MERKSLQFELWHECNNICKFCYLGQENRRTPTDTKIKTLTATLEKIKDRSIYQKYNNISFIGGEFFQGQLSDPTVKSLFMQIMDEAATLLKEGVIDSVWLCATLTIGAQEDLYETLEKFKDLPEQPNSPNGLWICTSYDTIGRFHIKQAEENWQYHMKNIHEKYSHVKFNTTIIITQDLVNKYLNDEISFEDFMNEYNTALFFKQPSPGDSKVDGVSHEDAKKNMEARLPGFFPIREQFIRFLIKFLDEYPVMYDKLFNIKYRADELYRNFNNPDDGFMLESVRHKGSKIEIDGEEVNPVCGHLMHYCAYIDSDKCVICDRNNILNMKK